MADSKMTLVGIASMAAGILALIVIYTVIPMVGAELDGAITITGSTSSTGTLTYSGVVNGSALQAVNISTETYTFTNGTSGEFYVDVESDTANASYACSQFVSEVTANGTFVNAATCTAANVTTLTSKTEGSDVNYATTENLTNVAFGAATMTGGTDGSDWNSTVNLNIPTAVSFWESLGGILKIGAILVVIGGLHLTIRGIRD